MSLEVGSFALDGPIVLAGAGKMGTALLSGWLARGLEGPQRHHSRAQSQR